MLDVYIRLKFQLNIERTVVPNEMHATHLLQGEVSTTYVTLIKCLVKYPPRPTIDWQYVQPNAYYPHYCKDLTKPKTRLLLVVHFFVHTSHSRHDITQRTHLVLWASKI